MPKMTLEVQEGLGGNLFIFRSRRGVRPRSCGMTESDFALPKRLDYWDIYWVTGNRGAASISAAHMAA